jgi:fructokinase
MAETLSGLSRTAEDIVTGLVRNTNSTCLIGRPFQANLEEELGRSLGMANDADCFTLAECRLGAGRGYGLVFGVIMGTGCRAAWIGE